MADETQEPTRFQRARAFLRRRGTAYKLTFDNETGRDVLADLARFCRAHESTFHPDARLSAVQQGRHEVWLRIQQHLNLTDEELWSLYGRKDA